MNEIIKADVNQILGKLFLQDYELIEVWWHTANKNFEFNTPNFIYQKDDTGRQRVYDYVQKCSLGQMKYEL